MRAITDISLRKDNLSLSVRKILSRMRVGCRRFRYEGAHCMNWKQLKLILADRHWGHWGGCCSLSLKLAMSSHGV